MPVVKIGGSIQKDERDFDLIVEKVRDYSRSPEKTIVVTSALRGVTNDLIRATENRDKAVDIVGEIYDKHVKLLSKTVDIKEFENAFRNLSKFADELFRIAWSIRVLDEMSPRVRDYILSFGERMSSVLMGAVLRSRGLDATTYPEPTLVTDDSFNEARVIESLSAEESKKLLGLSNKIIVVPGFIGKTKNDRYTTVGRGGSDYTATLLGKLLGIREVRLVTEVPGIMTADPRKFKGARTIPRLTLEEAMELAQMGAKRLHPRTFEPMLVSDIQVYIEGLYEPGHTLVSGSCSEEDGLKGIAMLENLKMISVESSKIVGKVGSAAAVMEEVKNAGVNIVSLSQPASETTIHIVVDSENSSKLVPRLQSIRDIDSVEVQDVSSVSAVGCGLRKREVFTKVLKHASSFEVVAISRGLRNVSVTFMVRSDEGFNLAKEIHEVIVGWIS